MALRSNRRASLRAPDRPPRRRRAGARCPAERGWRPAPDRRDLVPPISCWEGEGVVPTRRRPARSGHREHHGNRLEPSAARPTRWTPGGPAAEGRRDRYLEVAEKMLPTSSRLVIEARSSGQATVIVFVPSVSPKSSGCASASARAAGVKRLLMVADRWRSDRGRTSGRHPVGRMVITSAAVPTSRSSRGRHLATPRSGPAATSSTSDRQFGKTKPADR